MTLKTSMPHENPTDAPARLPQERRIVCFDMDGTLLDQDGSIHPNDAAILGSLQRPSLFIPCTGRPVQSLRRAFARNGLFRTGCIPLPLVLLNGSLLLGGNESPLAYHPFEQAVQEELIELAMQFRHITFWFLSEADILAQWPNPLSDAMAAGFDFTLQPLAECHGGMRFSKIMCVSDSPSALAELARAAADFPVESALSLPTVLELTKKGIDKASGIAELLQELGFAGRPVFAAGDGENDLPLFRMAARSFAPSTAPEGIRAAASELIDVSREGLLTPILAIGE